MASSVIQKYKKLYKKLKDLELQKSFILIDLDLYVTSRKNMIRSRSILINRNYASEKIVVSNKNLNELECIISKQTANIAECYRLLRENKNQTSVVKIKLSMLVK